MSHAQRNHTMESNSTPYERELIGAPLCVAEIMTVEVVSLSPDCTLADSVKIITAHSFHHFVITDKGGKLAGVISDRDTLHAVAHTSNWQAKSITHFMSRNVVTVTADTLMSQAAEKMVAHHINCLPVVDEENQVCGIVTSINLLKAYGKVQAAIERNAQL